MCYIEMPFKVSLTTLKWYAMKKQITLFVPLRHVHEITTKSACLYTFKFTRYTECTQC
jgi:hypothetical protein